MQGVLSRRTSNDFITINWVFNWEKQKEVDLYLSAFGKKYVDFTVYTQIEESSMAISMSFPLIKRLVIHKYKIFVHVVFFCHYQVQDI